MDLHFAQFFTGGTGLWTLEQFGLFDGQIFSNMPGDSTAYFAGSGFDAGKRRFRSGNVVRIEINVKFLSHSFYCRLVFL